MSTWLSTPTSESITGCETLDCEAAQHSQHIVPMRVQVLQPSGLPKDVNVSFLGSQKSHTLRHELVEALKPQVLPTPQLLMHCMLAM